MHSPPLCCSRWTHVLPLKLRRAKMAMASLSMLSSRGLTGAVSFRAPSTAPAAGRGSLVVVAASKKKDVRLGITLECTEQKASGVAGMSRYSTEKVRETTPADVPRVATRSDATRARPERSLTGGHKRGFALYFIFGAFAEARALVFSHGAHLLWGNPTTLFPLTALHHHPAPSARTPYHVRLRCQR